MKRRSFLAGAAALAATPVLPVGPVGALEEEVFEAAAPDFTTFRVFSGYRFNAANVVFAVGQREELANLIYHITPQQTPLLSLMSRKGALDWDVENFTGVYDET